MSRQARVNLGGSPLEDAILDQVEVTQVLNGHWYCALVCRDTLDHPIPGEDMLGQPCRISNVADDGTEHVTFDGIVIDVSLTREVWGSSTAVVRAASLSWTMDRSRRNRYFPTASLAPVAAQLTAGLPLSCELAAVNLLHEHIQYGETDWEFLLRLADDAGGWVRSGLGSIELKSSFDEAHPLRFREEYGLLEFSVDGRLPPGKVRAAHYDSAVAQSRISAGEQKTASLEAGGARMGAAIATGAAQQELVGFTGRSRAVAWGDMATRAQGEAERVHGAGVLAGGVSRDTTVTAGGALAVESPSAGFDAGGTWYVLKVKHLWTRKEYINEFTATPWAEWRGWARPRPPVVSGPQPGRVVANHDPENRGRVRVALYWQGGGPLLWAPVASAHASAGFGLMTTPEVGDEVLVGFLDSDPERPVVLGSVWNGAHAGPRERYETGHEAELAGNHVKRIVTKSGIRVHLVDTPGHESITVATPRSNRLVMTEHAEATGRPAVVLHTEGDIRLEAGGRVHRVAQLESHKVAPPMKAAAAALIPAAALAGGSAVSATPAPFPCKGKWAEEVAHTNAIANMQDPLERNRKISAEYAKIYQQDPNVQWAGLGAIVSRQAGCGMQAADRVDADANKKLSEEMQGNPEFQGDVMQEGRGLGAETGKTGLADANQLIYRTISPAMAFSAKYGAKQMQACLHSGQVVTKDTLADKSIPNDKIDNTAVHPQVADAVDSLAAGKNDKAAGQIARFEQGTVVQDRIYNQWKYWAVFKADQKASQYQTGRDMGALAPEIPLSADCTSEGKVLFDGSITSSNDRIGYYVKLSDQLKAAGTNQQQSTMQQIIAQGK